METYKIITVNGTYCGANSTGLSLNEALNITYSDLTPNSDGCAVPSSFILVNEKTGNTEYSMEIGESRWMKALRI